MISVSEAGVAAYYYKTELKRCCSEIMTPLLYSNLSSFYLRELFTPFILLRRSLRRIFCFPRGILDDKTVGKEAQRAGGQDYYGK